MNNTEMTNENERDSGIELIGKTPWGTHLCQFYQSKDDLIDILVPYFKAGLENNEYCMWVTSEPLTVKDATAALKKVVKNVDKYIKNGQLEILDYSEWYTRSGKFDAEKVLKGWVKKEKAALKSGFAGLRLTGNTFWLEKADWKKFKDYEEVVNSVICDHKMLAICSYSLDKCNASEVIDVVANHQFALIRRAGNWEIIESSEQKRAKEALQESEEKTRLFMEAATDSFTIWDAELNLVEENKNSNKFLPPKMRLENRIGKNMVDMMPDLKQSGRYDKYMEVIKTGEPIVIEDFVPHHKYGDRHWLVKAFKVGNGLGIITTDITERKKTEEKLRQSERQYQTLGETIPYGVWLTDATGYCTYVSDSFLELVDMTMEEVQEFGWLHLLPPEDVEPTKEHWLHCVETGEDFEREHRFRTKDSSYRNILAIGRPIRDDAGKIIRWVGLNLDITERKRAEEAIKESEEKFRLLTEQSLLGVIIIQDGLVKYVNQAASDITGYSNKEALDWKPNGFGRLFHPDDLEFVLEQAKKKQQGAKDVIINYQYRIITKSGEVKWVDQYSKTITLESKSADFITIIDITDRRRVEETLSHERDLMQTLFENSADFIYFKDKKARFHRVGKRFCEFFKCNEEDIIGKTDLELFPKEVAKITYHEDLEVIKTGKSLINKEESAAGTWVLTTKIPWKDKKGNIIGLFGISHDITHRKRTEEEIEKLAKFPAQNPNPVLRITKNGEIVYSNIASKPLLNYWKYKPNRKLAKKWLKFAKEALNKEEPQMAEVEYGGKVLSLMFAPITDAGFVNVYGLDITDRKSAEEELIKSEEKYRGLVDNISDTVVELDSEGNFSYISPQLLNTFGFEPDEIIGKNAFEFIHPDDLEHAMEKMGEALTSENIYNFEYRTLHKKGHYIDVSASGKMVKLGDESKIVGVVRDITERKRAENALRESEEKLRSILESSPDAITVTNLNGEIVDCNQATLRVHGFSSKDEVIGLNSFDFIAKKDQERAFENAKKTLKTGYLRNEEYTLLRKDGKGFPGELSASIITDSEGKPSLFVGVTKDITERKLSEEALQESNDRYRALFDRSLDGVYIHDFEGNFIEANPAALNMFGYNNIDVTKFGFKSLLTEDQLPLAIETLEELIKTGTQKDITEYYLRRKDGTDLWVETKASAIYKDGEPFAVQGIARDITERKYTEAKINNSLKEKEVLLQEIHHRVKNNMQVISSLLKLQAKEIKDKKMVEIFRESQNRIKSMALVHEKLYQSKDFANIKFDDYIKSLTNNLFRNYRISSNKIKLNMDIKDVPLEVDQAIPCGLIINELVSNSLKYAFGQGPSGMINIKLVSKDNENIELIVSDNGVGLPKNINYRNPQSLGLHLVNLLVEDQLHGKMRLDRTQGTKFQIEFKGVSG